MKRPIVTDFTETIYRADAYKYTQEQEKYIDYLEAQARQLILSGVVKSDSELLPYKDGKLINNMCLSYRHDFGLLNLQEKSDLVNDCKNWLIAYENNKK